jgi:hypothetical protein
MSKTTKEQIMAAVVNDYFNDLEFIEALNNLTYGRKVQLKANLKTNYEPRMD